MLADLLPALKHEPRLSKHIIVDASISHHKAQGARLHHASHAIQALLDEREDLLREVNALRALCHPDACIPRQARPIDRDVLENVPGPKELAADSDDAPQGLADVGSAPMPAAPPSTLPPSHVPQPPTTLPAEGQHPSIPHEVPWAWDQNHMKPAQSAPLPTSTNDEHSLLWNTSSGVLTQTPSGNAELGLDTNVGNLINDAALFWTQHPDPIHTTPPQDPSLSFDANLSDVTGDLSMLWPQNLAPATAAPRQTNDLDTTQHLFHSANIFHNQESLSL